ncbi:MAG TPA: SPFH domain-containing protein [Victivallales bacterium]|nr:SPFH domain-containing protein [Victivallales bacterium]
MNNSGSGTSGVSGQFSEQKVPINLGYLKGCLLSILILGSLVFVPVWIWFWWRIEPESGEFAVLIRKTGAPLPAGQILASDENQKGIRENVLPEGRYFRNPYTWDWRIHKITDIPAGKLGVKIRLYGENLPNGEIIAKNDNSKGILPDILAPGKYRINPYAYDVIIMDAIQIRPGHVGVITSLVGNDILNNSIPENMRNGFLVEGEMKGVLPKVLDPGTYYLNPYVLNVAEVNLQSQRFEVGGDEAISFLSQDGFPIKVEGTVEFNILREKAAMLSHKVGDMDDIINKIIVPRMRGFSRIEGSKKTAVEFIVGETRQQFQNSLQDYLRRMSEPWGLSVNSVLIRNIIPPESIAQVIRQRELAVQEVRKFEQQIEQAKSKAELTKQEMLAEQKRRKVQAETDKIMAEIAAKQDQEVKVIAAQREFDVAKINLDTTNAKIAAMMLNAGAEQNVIKRSNEAEAKVLADKVDAFGGGGAYARYLLYQRIAPALKDILTNDGTKGFGFPFPDEIKEK